MTWVNNLKVAIIEENIQTISELTNDLPKFENLNEANEALSLIKVAIDLANTKKEEILLAMKKIKKTKEFLNY